jgi:hypothetical protein
MDGNGLRGLLAGLIAFASLAGCGGDLAAKDEAEPEGSTLFLAAPERLWTVNSATAEVTSFEVPQIGIGDPPHLITSRADRLIAWGYDTWSIDAEEPGRPPERIASDSWIYIPAADPGRVWVGYLDAESPPGARGLGELREIGADGTVYTEGVAPPDDAWPYAEAASGLLFHLGGQGIAVFDPDTKRTVRELPSQEIGDMGPVTGDLLAHCPYECAELSLTDVGTGEEVLRVPAPEGNVFEVWSGEFSPSGDLLAVPVRERGSSVGGPRSLALVDRAGTLTLVAGSEVPGGYTFVPWSADGAEVFITGGGVAPDGEPVPPVIRAYRIGDEAARALDVDVDRFYDAAAR